MLTLRLRYKSVNSYILECVRVCVFKSRMDTELSDFLLALWKYYGSSF